RHESRVSNRDTLCLHYLPRHVRILSQVLRLHPGDRLRVLLGGFPLVGTHRRRWAIREQEVVCRSLNPRIVFSSREHPPQRPLALASTYSVEGLQLRPGREWRVKTEAAAF